MAQGSGSTPYRIDTHHHILPPAYVAEERERILAAAGMVQPDFVEWTPQKALDEMDRNGVATAITSMSTPGVWFGDREQARRLARLCNDYGAEMSRDFPGRFGMLAALPLPDVEGSLREIEYALDVLKLDGIGLMTSYGDRWPGDPAFAPIFDELNRRKSVVFFHPTAANCCPSIPDLAPALIEFPTDTARTITTLLFSGTFSRCPDLRFVFSHGGGTLPMLVSRLVGALARPSMQKVRARVADDPMQEIQRQYYDTASIANPVAIAAVTKFVPSTQLLLGTDYPYWPIAANAEGLRKLGLSEADLALIERENALHLFPRFRR